MSMQVFGLLTLVVPPPRKMYRTLCLSEVLYSILIRWTKYGNGGGPSTAAMDVPGRPVTA